jgi:hypothetical protein
VTRHAKPNPRPAQPLNPLPRFTTYLGIGRLLALSHCSTYCVLPISRSCISVHEFKESRAVSHDRAEMYSSTIEPRLIALLNTDEPSEVYATTTTTTSSLELPPLHDPNILKASGRPLLLEPDTSKRNGKLSPSSQLSPQHPGLMSSLDDDEPLQNSAKPKKQAVSGTERALGSSSPQSLRKILDDNQGTGSASSKKRNLVESSKDDFVQLPQPPKKQKATKQVVPPIIIGLFEPPPQAALFPPIASSSFHDSHGRNSLNTFSPAIKERGDDAKPEDCPGTTNKKKPSAKQSLKKDVKARKKWTEEETNNLLLGVHKHGVGRWTDILEDRSFSFNNRSGVDLKDRFRTCCPDELRGKASALKDSRKGFETSRKFLGHPKSRSSLMSENILIDDDVAIALSTGTLKSSNSRKSRAHRKRLEDLAQLGIEGPFRKSQRRERRPFSEEDDREILLGYTMYGPAWTRIQRDTSFHLQSRQPTDLRDRFRNKYPEKLRLDETISKDTHALDLREAESSIPSQSTTTLQQSSSREGLRIHQIISENSRSFSKAQSQQVQCSSLGFKDTFGPFSEQSEAVHGLPPFDLPFTGSMGEMDISRLLLDESWIEASNGKERQNFNSILASSAEGLPPIPSFYNMLVNDEQISMPCNVSLDQDSSFG